MKTVGMVLPVQFNIRSVLVGKNERKVFSGDATLAGSRYAIAVLYESDGTRTEGAAIEALKAKIREYNNEYSR